MIQKLMKKPIKICFVLPSMLGGGVETFILRLGNYLQQHGYDVDVLTTLSPGFQFREIEENKLHGISLTSTLFTIPVIHAKKIAKVIRSNKYDIVFNNNCPLTQIISGQLRDDCTLITIIHGNVDYIFNQQLSNDNNTNLYIGISPAIINRSEEIIQNRQVIYIPHGVDIPFAESENERILPSRFHVNLLYSGRLEDSDKGVMFLPEILDKVLKLGISATLYIAGDGQCREQLFMKFDVNNLLDNVKYLGYLTKEQLYKHYQESHILLFPSKHEGFGLSLIESMAFGCVPIASLISGVTDTIIRNNIDGILVPIGNTQAFTDSVAKLCNKPLLWKLMSGNGINRIPLEFSFINTANKYMKVIDNSLNGHYSLIKNRRNTLSYDINLLRIRHFLPVCLLKIFVKCLSYLRPLF